VGLRAGLDRCGKSRPPPGIDPRAVQPVASRYTDCAIPAQQYTKRVAVFPLQQWLRERSTMLHDAYIASVVRMGVFFMFFMLSRLK
jgi:hypothetical protein